MTCEHPNTREAQTTDLRVYVASRASVPERSAMWRELRDRGAKIVSTWIDEAGEGETADFGELWARIYREIESCDRLVLYAVGGDFPLKGALVEVGIALGLKKPVWIMGNFDVEGRTMRPIGSWVKHSGVHRVNLECSMSDMDEAVGL